MWVKNVYSLCNQGISWGIKGASSYTTPVSTAAIYVINRVKTAFTHLFTNNFPPHSYTPKIIISYLLFGSYTHNPHPLLLSRKD